MKQLEWISERKEMDSISEDGSGILPDNQLNVELFYSQGSKTFAANEVVLKWPSK